MTLTKLPSRISSTLRNGSAVVCGALSLAAPLAASASGSMDGLISGILTQRTGQTFFDHSGTRTARPACAVADRWVIDMTTPAGQALLSTILTAYSTGRTVRLEGTGNCDVWGDTESLFYVYITN